MKQITYEEAKKALNEMYAVLNDSNRWNKHKDLLNEVLNQHKPPTFDEVISFALKNNFDCWYEEDLNRIVFGAVLPEFFVYKDKVVSAMPQTNHYFKDYEMFDMGRRYLESQKEKKNEKTVNAKNRKQRIFNRTATPRK